MSAYVCDIVKNILECSGMFWNVLEGLPVGFGLSIHQVEHHVTFSD